MIKIVKIKLISQSEFIHNLYCESGEPDAPRKIWLNETSQAKDQIFKRHKEVARLLVSEKRILGFFIFAKLKEGLNIGGAIVPEERGKGFGKRLFLLAAKMLEETYPGQKIFASTRTENISAIKSLKKAGFIFLSKELKPPIDGVCGEIEYMNFIYKSKN